MFEWFLIFLLFWVLDSKHQYQTYLHWCWYYQHQFQWQNVLKRGYKLDRCKDLLVTAFYRLASCYIIRKGFITGYSTIYFFDISKLTFSMNPQLVGYDNALFVQVLQLLCKRYRLVRPSWWFQMRRTEWNLCTTTHLFRFRHDQRQLWCLNLLFSFKSDLTVLLNQLTTKPSLCVWN